jgi:DNA polymerase
MDDNLKEVYDLARRALECQADLGHREIIFEARCADGGTHQNMENFGVMENSDSQLPVVEPEMPLSTDSQYKSLDEQRMAICDCTKCPLGHTRTNFVFGVGSPNSKIMFIGEAPGRDEDMQGEPFVGRAGKLLDKIIIAMGFKREDVYIANILKCRPPENRDPQPDEMRKCIPYLKEQIHLIKPQFICALGRIAAHGLLQTTTPLGKLRGQWHSFESTPLIVTYHPAALLRFQQYKRPTWEDMQLLMKEYERLNK